MLSPILDYLCLTLTSSPPVDEMRQSLSAHSERMFFWLVISSAVTGLGVVLEAPGEFHELSRWLKLRKLGRKVGWRVPITFLGLAVVTAGIIGEGVFEFLSSDAETAIRGHDEQVLGETIIQAGTAKDSAEAAVGAAKHASEIANDAERKAEGANREIVKAEVETARVEEEYAPRHLSKAKRAMLIELLSKARPAGDVGIDVSADAPDGSSYATEIADAMSDSATGWKASAGGLMTSDGRSRGVFILIHDTASAPQWVGPLLEALKETGIDCQLGINSGISSGTAVMLVERK